MAPIAEFRGICKRFGNTQAVRDLDLSVESGHVHAIVGENGAGKSTLGKVLAGLYAPDAGKILVDGSETTGHWSVSQAQQRGIVMIAQELSLVPDLTVAQNIFLGRENTVGGLLKRDLRGRFDELDASIGFGLDPNARLGDLKIADQQKVEIMRAFARDARVLILDEPTSSLTGHEAEQLHAVMRDLATRGSALIYVSHFLDSVLDVSDVVTVMRNGSRVATTPAPDITKSEMITLMLGREFESAFPDRPESVPADIDPILELDHVAGPGVVDASLIIRPGEVVGLLGLVGSGRTEIARLVFGVADVSAGTVKYRGKQLPVKRRVIHSIRDGIAMVPEDRHGQGLFLGRSVLENIGLNALKRFIRLGILRPRAERRDVALMVHDLDIRPNDPSLEVEGLSGGNQQKVLLAKWLIDKPRLVILDEPTRGVDVGAKFAIYRLIVDLAASGVAVLLISSEHEEILNLANRASLVSEGRVVGDLDPSASDVSDVLSRLFEAQESVTAKESAHVL